MVDAEVDANSPKQDLDAFLAYNNADQEAVKRLARILSGHGIRLWVDLFDLRPGMHVIGSLEQARRRCRKFIAVIGPSELGRWQQQEIWAALTRSFNNRGAESSVVPVLLPNSKPENLPDFLATISYVQFEHSLDEEQVVRKLVAGIRDVAPNYRAAIPLFVGQVQRNYLFDDFLQFAQERNIVFAIGARGSGLTTFKNQLLEFIHSPTSKHDHVAVDFDQAIFKTIREYCDEENQLKAKYQAVGVTGMLDLKCLLASLAYTTYMGLRENYSIALDRHYDSILVQPAHFADYYFRSRDKFDQEPKRIVRYFFKTIDDFTKATESSRVLVFMPWLQLGACFRDEDPFSTLGKVAKDLWEGLRELANEKSGKEPNQNVCLVVAITHVLSGITDTNKNLIRAYVWAMPPLTDCDLKNLLEQLSVQLTTDECVRLLVEWTGGSPWLVRFALSYIQHELQTGLDLLNEASIERLIRNALEAAESAILFRSSPAHERASAFLKRYVDDITDFLGDFQPTDTTIEEAWAGTIDKRKNGLPMSPRFGRFLASGLFWPEKNGFQRYPTVSFRMPGRLAVAVYNTAMKRQLNLWKFQ